MSKEKIREYLYSNRKNIVEDLCRLIKIPSVTGTDYCITALNSCRELLDTVAEETVVYEKDLYALGRVKGNEKNIGIFAHCDVVPADESEWSYSKPFLPTVKGNCVIGRGAEDDKGGFIQGLYALKCIKELGLPLKSSVTFFVGGSEEAGGMKDIIAYRENNPMPDISFSPDCDFPFSMGEKSMIHLTAKRKTPFKSISELKGGTVMNAVPSKARAVLNTGEIITADGTGCHAAMPENGISAIKLICQELCKNPCVDIEDKETLKEIALMQSDFYGSHIGISAQEESFGRLTCVMGVIGTENSTPYFTLDVRFGAATDINKTADAIDRYLNEIGFEISEIERSEGFALVNHPAKERLASIYNQLGYKGEPYISAGGTYSRVIRNSFSIGVACGDDQPDVKLPLDKGGPHQSDELICVDRLINGIEVLVNYLLCVDEII